MRPLETELSDRTLRFDGVSVVHPEQVADLLLKGTSVTQLRVKSADEEVELFNREVPEELQLRFNTDPVKLSFRWQLPERYLQLDVIDHIFSTYGQRGEELFKTYTEEQYQASIQRVAAEVDEITRRGMVDFFRAIIYVLDVFREKKVVWGVGRGSSCASYVLFLLGLHMVDPIVYDVSMDEFFHD